MTVKSSEHRLTRVIIDGTHSIELADLQRVMSTATSPLRRTLRWLKTEGLAIALMVFLALNVYVVVHYGFGGAEPGESPAKGS